MSGLDQHYPRGRTLGLLKASLLRKEEKRGEKEEAKANDVKEEEKEVVEKEEIKKVEAKKRSKDTAGDNKENEPSDKKAKNDIKVEVERDNGATKVTNNLGFFSLDSGEGVEDIKEAKDIPKAKKKEKKEVQVRAGNKEKAFKELTNTIKKKCSELSPKLGETVDFALFIKDVIHDPKAKPTSPMAEKIISFTSGTLKEIFQEQGLRYNPDDYFDLASEKNFKPSEFQESVMEKVKEETTKKDKVEEKDEVAAMEEVKEETTKKDKVEEKDEVKDKPDEVAKEIKDKGNGKKITEEVRELSPYEKIREANVSELKSKLAEVGKLSDLNKDDKEKADEAEKEV